MNEATKLRERWTREGLIDKYLAGYGLDVGCGNDKILPSADGWDWAQGDAQQLEGITPASYDYLFSSHCLEHLADPREAIRRWWEVVKPGGYMVLLVPDEDLYEQGMSPSGWNEDHRWTFTTSKHTSWSPRSLNVTDLIAPLADHLLLSLRIIDTTDHSLTLCDQTRQGAEANIELILQKLSTQPTLTTTLSRLCRCGECGRSELQILGITRKGDFAISCRACGAGGNIPPEYFTP